MPLTAPETAAQPLPIDTNRDHNKALWQLGYSNTLLDAFAAPFAKYGHCYGSWKLTEHGIELVFVCCRPEREPGIIIDWRDDSASRLIPALPIGLTHRRIRSVELDGAVEMQSGDWTASIIDRLTFCVLSDIGSAIPDVLDHIPELLNRREGDEMHSIVISPASAAGVGV